MLLIVHAKHDVLGEPPLAFLIDELLDPPGPDDFQVFDLANAVVHLVALIEMPQVRARKFRARTAKSSGALAANA